MINGVIYMLNEFLLQKVAAAKALLSLSLFPQKYHRLQADSNHKVAKWTK